MEAMEKIKLAVGADHGGFLLKKIIISHLNEQGFIVEDCGSFDEKSSDYPVYAKKVAGKVSNGSVSFGIMIDGVGIGSAMIGNRFTNVRAAPAYSVFMATSAREHNDANMLTLGGGVTGPLVAQKIVDAFLTHKCSVPRHKKRVDMINNLDKIPSQTYINVGHTIAAQEDIMTDITEKDVEKIAGRVREMLSGTSGQTEDKTDVDNEKKMICQCGVHVEKKPETIRKFLEFGVDRIGYNNASGGECVPGDIARCIDHTILKPDATDEDIIKLCSEAREYRFASVCISPSYVQLAAEQLRDSDVKVCTVVGFPSGAHMPEIKSMETRRAIRDGAKEIDMVINIGALKSKNDDLVYRDIRMVCEACEDGGALSKVIIETAFLTDEEKIRACTLAKKAKADYVKTSTGFGPHGATAKDVALMNSVVKEAGLGVKAAGGIRTFDDAKAMIEAGASRIGASAGIKIVKVAKDVTVKEQ